MNIPELFPKNRPWKGDVLWTIAESDFFDYMVDFSKVDTDGKVINALKQLKLFEEPVVIDLMAPTSALDSLYRLGLRGKLLAVGKNDYRQLVPRKPDAGMGVDYYEGDLKSTGTWRYIDSYLDGADANIIMERGYGGLHHIRTDPYFDKAILTRMWSMLSPRDGVMVLQTPNSDALANRNISMDKWTDQLDEAGIYAKFGNMGTGKDHPVEYGVLILEKSSASQKLPILQTDLVGAGRV